MTTKSTGKVEVICSLIPGVDETVMLGHLKARSDHDTPLSSIADISTSPGSNVPTPQT
jgi:hypothetical protein